VSLDQVIAAWPQILSAVRRRNPAAEGALRTGCEPVEVTGNQVTVTFPYTFLREKLGDDRRKSEILDALAEILGTDCRLKLVLASEYAPGQSPQSRPPAPEPKPETVTPDGESQEPTDQDAPFDTQELDKLSRWAEEHGGETKLIDQ
jgi:hypothetical protein